MDGQLLGAELEHLLHRWKPKNSGSELAGILFDLYFEVRNLVENLKPKIRQASRERTAIFKYNQLFEPFIIYWLRLSQLHVRHCISASLKKDTLTPVKSDELYSISIRDVFKTLVESVECVAKLTFDTLSVDMLTFLDCILQVLHGPELGRQKVGGNQTSSSTP